MSQTLVSIFPALQIALTDFESAAVNFATLTQHRSADGPDGMNNKLAGCFLAEQELHGDCVKV